MNKLDTIKANDIPSVGDLMQIARNSAGFLGAAASKVDDPALKTLLGDMARSRSHFVAGAEKQLQVAADAAPKSVKTPVTPDSTVMAWDDFYAELQPQVGGKSLAFVDSVQASETRLLNAFDNLAADSTVPAGLKQVLTGYLPILRKQHSLVSSREWAKAS